MTDRTDASSRQLAAVAGVQAAFIRGPEAEAVDQLILALGTLGRCKYGFFAEVVRELDTPARIEPVRVVSVPATLGRHAAIEPARLTNLLSRLFTATEEWLELTDLSPLAEGHPPLENLLVIPFRGNGRELVAVIGIANRDGAFTLEVREQLAPLVEAAAMIVDARRRQLQRERAHQELLLQRAVGFAIAEAPDLRSAWSAALKLLLERTGWDFVQAWIREGMVLETPAYHTSDPRLASVREISQSARFEIGEGLPGQVWLGKQRVVVSELRDLRRDVRARALERAGLRSAFAIPVFAGTDVVAVLELFAAGVAGAEDARRLDLVASCAAHIGGILERKRSSGPTKPAKSEGSPAVREAFDAIDWPVAIFDTEGRFVEKNRAARQRSDDMEREPWVTVRRLIEGGNPARELRLPDPESGSSWEISVYRVPSGSLAIARDVTSREALHEDLRHHETVAALARIVAGVAHEVRNPLFGIGATVDAFEARFASSPEHASYLRILRGELGRLADLMRDLLDFGRPPALLVAPCPLDAVVIEALSRCEKLAETAGVELRHEGRESAPVVEVDRGRMVQVFVNLLENALQHSPRGGVVAVRHLPLAEGKTRVLIEDDGPGFGTSDLQRIFEPFFTKRPGGTGLGLSIVQRIVEQHEGEVAAKNRPGGGGAVTVTLPGR